MSATSSLARLRALAPDERRWLAHAMVLLPLARAGLRTLGLRRTRALLRRAVTPGLNARAGDPARVARMVAIAARRGPFRAKCLPAAVALESLLSRVGIASELRLGVRKRGSRLEAHAWVEHAGLPLMEEGEPVHAGFAPFERAL